MSYRYTLKRYGGTRSRHTCPSCGRTREFARYVDTQTGDYLAEHVGRCNREVNCGYHYTPKQYYADNKISSQGNDSQCRPKQTEPLKQETKRLSFIAFEVFRRSLIEHSENNLVRFLHSLFGSGITGELIKRFYVGTSKYWEGATIFWQIDVKGRIRSGKIMLYCPSTGKRIKEPFNHIHWVHSVLAKRGAVKDFHLRQCLFGEHQLIGQPLYRPVAIVESEKTAIIASVHLPELIWLACGSVTNLTPDKCGALIGRRIVLFPDLNCFERWKGKARELQSLIDCRIAVSDLLENKAREEDKAKGFDIADYLIRHQPGAELPDEIFVPPSCPNTEIALARCIDAQRVDLVPLRAC